MVIYAFVDASTENDALTAGRPVFDRLVGATHPDGAIFDYFVTFDDEQSTVAGPAHLGGFSVAALIESDAGQQTLTGEEAAARCLFDE